jgi:hypothetical protein
MQLLILFGPPSVGKLLEEQTDFKLFHNYMIMDGVMHIFGVESPAENRLSRIIRASVMEEAAAADVNLIFTYVWDFAQDKGKRNIDAYKHIYESRGGVVRFVELIGPLETRVERANNPDRLRYKAYAGRGDMVAALEATHSHRSPSPFFYPDIYKQIDTTDKKPPEIAEEIRHWLGVV